MTSRSLRPTEPTIQPAEETQPAADQHPPSLCGHLCPLLSAPLFDLNHRIHARFGVEQVLAVHFQHHRPIPVERDQTPPPMLRLSPSTGVHHQGRPAQHVRPPASLIVVSLVHIYLSSVEAPLLPMILVRFL